MITNNNEKEDVIQDITEEGSSAKLRKYLILGGGVFIIFVIGIVISKFLFEPEQPVKSKVVLPSEIEKKKVAMEEHGVKKEKKENSELFNDIPVETPKVEKREKDKVVEENNFPTKDSLIAEEEKKEKEEQQVVEKRIEEMPKEKREEKEIQIVKAENRKVEPQKEEKSNKNSSTMVKVKELKIEKKEEPKRVEKKEIATKSSDKNYYIQVAAFTKKEPDLKFLKKIEEYGFNYKIVEVKKGDLTIKRVLIGPYSRKEAKQHLLEVKEKINLKSFIKRVK